MLPSEAFRKASKASKAWLDQWISESVDQWIEVCCLVFFVFSWARFGSIICWIFRSRALFLGCSRHGSTKHEDRTNHLRLVIPSYSLIVDSSTIDVKCPHYFPSRLTGMDASSIIISFATNATSKSSYCITNNTRSGLGNNSSTACSYTKLGPLTFTIKARHGHGPFKFFLQCPQFIPSAMRDASKGTSCGRKSNRWHCKSGSKPVDGRHPMSSRNLL